MTRIGKQEQRRNMCPKKRKPLLSQKTGPKEEKGFKKHDNALNDDSLNAFIPKIK